MRERMNKYECDMRNKSQSQSERKIFLQIQSKLSRELINAKTATPKQTKITVSKLSHRLSRNGWISYNCELRKGRTCLAAVDQEGVGGDERVAWNNTEHYLLIHHWIIGHSKRFLEGV